MQKASVVDYVVASLSVFPLISQFSIGDFNECLSDVHCPIFLALTFEDVEALLDDESEIVIVLKIMSVSNI